ncbi:NPC intracellular cholesterol transporter 2 homolog a [Procambarus clarkii]|uniref:NPC intracellular cholesterol transporter 2 homolog a n=1 Tax=Procambarus clarkii TaxID=6728 RepID=UPI001E671B71|nr:NPC intracellular cholesterol transporter 2 homolog a-like [Procambarus clarkii]
MRTTRQLVVVVLLLLGSAQATLYQDCGSDAEIQELVVQDCDIPPCVIHRPSSQDLNITFIPAHPANKLDTIINANIGGENFPWPGPSGCPLLVDESCPIEPGHSYKYHAVMPVYAEYPALSVIVTWKVQDENGINHVCLVFPIVLV